MASYHELVQQSRIPFESPAKVFAKLKSKVQREAMNEAPFTDEVCCDTGKRGGVFKETPKKTTDHWAAVGLRQLQRFGNGEVTAVTLSPISSPQENMGYSYSTNSYRPEDELSSISQLGHAFKLRNAYMPTERAFWESTAVGNPPNFTTAQQSHLDRFHVTVESADPRINSDPGVFEEDTHPQLNTHVSVFSPMRKRLRKRKLYHQEMHEVNSGIDDVTYTQCQAKERKNGPAFSEDEYFTSNEQGVACLPPEEPMMAPSHPAKTRCNTVEAPPAVLMSPAKMFAYMKERETQREKTEDQRVSSSTGRQADWDKQSEFRATADSTSSNKDRMGNSEECPDGQLDTDPPETDPDPAPVSVAPSQPVLLEDPLVLNSPRFSIPKKQEAVFKRSKWPQYATFPSENVIYLKKWFLRKNHKGLFVDGIHRENNIPWNSNNIIDRVSNTVLKTVTGRVYILVGKIDLNAPTEFPKWFLKSFTNGFPSNWKELYEKYLSESKGNQYRTKETQNKSTKAKTEASMNLSVKQHRQKSSMTPESCPPSAVSSTKVSRSGRLIKPPLEYWKGGRVILDAHMNVTIHECYDTSICLPQVTATVSRKSAQTSPVVMVPLNEEYEQREPTVNIQPSAILRRVKVPRRKRDKTRISTQEKPSSSPKNSPTDRVTRSSLRNQATEKLMYVETVQSGPKRTFTQKTKPQKKETKINSGKGSCRSVSTDSPPNNDSSSPQPSINDETVALKKKREKAIHKKSKVNVCNLSRSSSLLSDSSDGNTETQKSQKMLTKNNVKRQTKQKRSTKISPPFKTTQSKKTHKGATSNTSISPEQDEDEWTEAELARLQEAVSCYPKHIAGYWTKVAKTVGTRSAEECHKQHTSMGTSKTPAKQDKKNKKKKAQPLKDKGVAQPVISARVGTLRRKQQVRDFLEAMPKEDMDDVFSSAYMQSKRFEVPSMCPSEEHDFSMSDLEPLTPRSTVFPEVKTPQCLHITPGMMGSTSRNYDDKYVFQLQKRMKNNQYQFNVQKHAPPKNFTPTASVKKTMRRCGNTENDTFVVWEMFPDKDVAEPDSDEEEDFYFSENN